MRTVIVNGSQKQIAAAQKEIDEIVSGAGYYGPVLFLKVKPVLILCRVVPTRSKKLFV